MNNKTLTQLMQESKVPSYVSLRLAKKIIKIMEKDLIHPNKGACDMTLEISAGIPSSQSVKQYILTPELPSIYHKLFELYKTEVQV